MRLTAQHKYVAPLALLTALFAAFSTCFPVGLLELGEVVAGSRILLLALSKFTRSRTVDVLLPPEFDRLSSATREELACGFACSGVSFRIARAWSFSEIACRLPLAVFPLRFSRLCRVLLRRLWVARCVITRRRYVLGQRRSSRRHKHRRYRQQRKYAPQRATSFTLHAPLCDLCGALLARLVYFFGGNGIDESRAVLEVITRSTYRE